MKKANALFMTAFLIISFPSALAAKEKPGADIIVLKADGGRLDGELIAVKKDLLLLLAGGASAEITHSIAWDAIAEVIVVRKSRFGQGLALGALIGGASGFFIGLSGSSDLPGFMSWSALDKAGFGAISLGLAGLIIGGIGGASKGADISIPVDSHSEANLRIVRAKLAERARIKGIQ